MSTVLPQSNFPKAQNSPYNYADDMLIYKPISTSSNYRELQEDINIIFQWSVENILTFNAAKCKCMLLSMKRTTIDPYPTMMLNDQPLEIVQQYKYLGLLVSSNISWTPHIRSICNKARRILGVIYRKFSRNTDYFDSCSPLYCSFNVNLSSWGRAKRAAKNSFDCSSLSLVSHGQFILQERTLHEFFECSDAALILQALRDVLVKVRVLYSSNFEMLDAGVA